MTPFCYEGVLLSIPGVREIDVCIDVAEQETGNTFQISTASQPIGQTRASDKQSFVHIRLHAWPALTTVRKIASGESIGVLSLLFRDQTGNQQRLHVSGVKGRDEQALVELFIKTSRLKSLKYGIGGGSLNDRDADQNTRFEIQQCHLSTEMTEKLWSCLKSFTSLNQLSISDSFLSFPPSPPELPSVTNLSAERITVGLRRTGGLQLTHIKLIAPSSLPPVKNCVSTETMRGLGSLTKEQTKNLQWLGLSGMKSMDEEDFVELVESSTYLKALDSPYLKSIDYESFNNDGQSEDQCLYFTRCEDEQILDGFARSTDEVLSGTTKTSPEKTVSVGIPTSKARILSIDEQHEDEDKYHSERIVDQTGGELHIPSYGLTLCIPPGTLQEGSSETITLDVLPDIPPEITLRHDETLVTYGFQCLPSGLQFESEKPVRLKIPHCANLIDPTQVQVVLYSMNHGKAM
eukprot:XP_011680362.1 PREDICTED: uncharacterized protein LOC105445915 [Strongylocentrotus purpuratus]